MLTIKMTSAAKEDLQKGARYYNHQQAGLGQKFKAGIQTSFEKIRKMPEAGSFVFDEVRYKVIKGFPYIVTYTINEEYILILRVFNTHLNPE